MVTRRGDAKQREAPSFVTTYPPRPRLAVVPVTLREANAYVERLHRHHGAVRGHKFSVAVADESGRIRGVAIAGRPRSRHLQDGRTLEVLRVCTDGCPNAPSALYAACWRAGRAMGYLRCVTYTLETEPGTSLVASGWKVVHRTKAEPWDRPSRPREEGPPAQLERKWRWEVAG